MDRHRHHSRGDDRDRHHRSNQHSREENYSLGELKERARREIVGSDHHRSSSSSRDHYHRDYRSRDDQGGRRQSRSRSPSRNNRGRYEPHEQVRHRRSSPNRNHTDDYRGGGRRQHDGPRQERPPQQFNRHRNEGENFSSRTNAEAPSTEGPKAGEEEGPPPEIKPNFELTGNLAKDTNTFNGVLVKYHEPAEAKKPRKRWRFYPFKGDTPLDFIALHRQSAYLFGRDRRVADVPVDHPSCSKQHAVLQFRSVEVTKPDGTASKATRPYIIDLESGNGTFVNSKQIEAKRYVELMEKDVVKFGFSSREYVLLHDQSQDDELEGQSDEEA